MKKNPETLMDFLVTPQNLNASSGGVRKSGVLPPRCLQCRVCGFALHARLAQTPEKNSGDLQRDSLLELLQQVPGAPFGHYPTAVELIECELQIEGPSLKRPNLPNEQGFSTLPCLCLVL